MNETELRARARAVDWWHSGIDLGHGVITKGKSRPRDYLLPFLKLPDDLTGKSVLDICAWDGYMAFECERRGAAKVVAVDSFAWGEPKDAVAWHKTGRAGFDLAHEALASKVIPVHCDVLDLSAKVFGTFDIVLFLGVLYHMRNPFLALERIAPLVGDMLILESHTDATHTTRPMMAFYPGDEINSDATNWWGPNPACIKAMLKDVGLARIETLPGNGTRAVMKAWRENEVNAATNSPHPSAEGNRETRLYALSGRAAEARMERNHEELGKLRKAYDELFVELERKINEDEIDLLDAERQIFTRESTNDEDGDTQRVPAGVETITLRIVTRD